MTGIRARVNRPLGADHCDRKAAIDDGGSSRMTAGISDKRLEQCLVAGEKAQLEKQDQSERRSDDRTPRNCAAPPLHEREHTEDDGRQRQNHSLIGEVRDQGRRG